MSWVSPTTTHLTGPNAAAFVTLARPIFRTGWPAGARLTRMEDMADRRKELSVSQMVIGNLMGVLQKLNKLGGVIETLEQRRQTGDNIAASQLELMVHTAHSINGDEPLLVEQDLTDLQILQFNAAAGLLPVMLVAPMDDEAARRLGTLISEWGGKARELGGEEGSYYVDALQLIVNATGLAQAAREMHRKYVL